jgi:transcriptional regulator with XRE-family HTH domain
MDTNKVYQNIRSLRELKKITREDISAQLGLTLSGYGKIERGEVDIQLSRLVAISNILQVDLATLLDFDVKQVFNFNLQQNALVQAPGAHAQTLNLYGNLLQEKYVDMLEKEIERLSGRIEERKMKEE